MSSQMTYKPEWIREDFVDFIAEKINPMWSWKKVKASVQQVEKIGADFFKITLKPNRNFQYQQLQAGQSILVTVVIAGVRQQRSYSVIEMLPNGDLVIGVKVQGLVSTQLAKLLKNDVVEISQGQGEFVLAKTPQPIVLIASGSGITAIYALLKQALAQNFPAIDLIYFSRDEAFHVELEQLASQHPQLNYLHIHTAQTKQHLDVKLLLAHAPEYQTRMTYACGANGMMKSINQIYQEQGLGHLLKQEYFQLLVDENAESQKVLFQRSQHEFEAKTNLLQSAEQAGLKPAHGCRIGICNTCTCTKISGSTKNLLTGEINHQSNTRIKLCISQAVSPVVINL